MNMTDVDVTVNHYFGGGVYSKEMLIPAGTLLGQHVHTYDHLSILASGQAIVIVDNVPTAYTGPACLVIQANKQHMVHALTDTVWYCIHATDDPHLNEEN